MASRSPVARPRSTSSVCADPPRWTTTLDRLARAAVLDRGGDVVGVGDLLAADGRDHVTDLHAGRSAGAAGVTAATVTPPVPPARGDAEVGALDRLAALQARDHVAHRVRRHREADARRCRRDCEAICELTPITRPVASSSGPPELPGLIGASVWITESIWKPSGAWMWRPVPETMPAVVVCESPNGEPIATASWPVRTVLESASASGLSVRDVVTFDDREVGGAIDAADRRPSTVWSSANCTCTVGSVPTTWALVTIVPSASTTKPVPEPVVGLDRHDASSRAAA